MRLRRRPQWQFPEYEDPTPTGQAPNTVHLADTIGEETAEGAGDGSGREEHRLSELDLLSTIPHREIILVEVRRALRLKQRTRLAEGEKAYSNTREQTSLSNSQKEASDEKSVIVLDNSHEGHYNSPRDHNGWQPLARREPLEQQVAGDFEGSIGEEEDGEAPVVLIRCDV